MDGGAVQLAAGTIVAGRYRVESRIGEGGMAVVYRAHHMGTDSPCALKFIHPRLLAEQELLQQFLNEARIAAKIGSHPHIVTVFDTGLDGTLGLPFIAMELLTGKPLRKLIAKDAPLSWGAALGLLSQLADALDEAHEAGIIHRDLKPSNVFVAEDRRGRQSVKVLDFGIAKLVDSGGENTATEVGTPWYNAPEQLGSKMRALAATHGITIAAQVSPATDIWALGLIAFELLSGTRTKAYWGARTVSDQMLKVALDQREPPSVRAGVRARYLPHGFDQWFLRCLRHNAAERWASAGEAVRQLGAVIDAAAARASSPTASTEHGVDSSASASSQWPALSGVSALSPSVPPTPVSESAAAGLAPGQPPVAVVSAPGAGFPPVVAGPPSADASDLDSSHLAETTPRVNTVQSWHATAGGTKPRTRVALVVSATVLVFAMLGAIALLLIASSGSSDSESSAMATQPVESATPDESASPPAAPTATASEAASESEDAGAATSATASSAVATAPRKAPAPRPRPHQPRPRPAKPKPVESDPFGRSQQ